MWRLRERHQDVLRQKLYKLKQEQGVESEPLFPIIKEEPENERPMWVVSFLPERSDLQVLNFFKETFGLKIQNRYVSKMGKFIKLEPAELNMQQKGHVTM